MSKEVDILVLDAGLFDAAEVVSAALDGMTVNTIVLMPETMNDAEWDDVLSQILLAKKVVTL